MVNRRSEKIGDYDGLYATVTINEPSAVFEDKTIDYNMSLDDYHSDKLSNVIKAMNNENIINANVICPWSCSTSCREYGIIPLDIIIQRMSPKIIIPIYTDSPKYRLIQSSWNQYFCCNVDEKPTILLNNNWPIKPSIQIDKEG